MTKRTCTHLHIHPPIKEAEKLSKEMGIVSVVLALIACVFAFCVYAIII
jgi:hypothetical protein